MMVNITRHDEIVMAGVEALSVQLVTTSGYLGVNPGHEYKVSKLLPGVIKVEVTKDKFENFFASGGFAHMNNNASIDVACAECVPLRFLDLSLAEKELAAAQERAKSSNEKEKAIGE